MRAVLRRWWPVVPLVVFFFVTGVRGLDFGHHWDEPWFLLPVKRFAAEGQLLPRAYNYPSLSYYLSYVAGLPEVLSALLSGKTAGEAHRALGPAIDTFDFRLRTRMLFLAVTTLTVVFVYGSILATRRSVSAAVAGTALVVGSFEVAYHARWVAPDGPLLAWVALTLWGLAGAMTADQTRSATRWRRWAAVGAGLATGTKYPAGLLVLPVVATIWLSPAPPRRRIFAAVQAVAIFAAAYLVTTPATVLDTELFLTHIRIQMKTYGGGFGAYTVSAGLDHLGKMLVYLGADLWSWYAPVGLALTGITLLGVGRMVLERPRLAAVVLAFPILFIAYFSLQRTMIVRNLLVVAPSLAIAFAWGAELVCAWGTRPVQKGLTAVLGVTLAVNLAFVVSAAETVRSRKDRTAFTRDAAAYLDQRGGRVFVSPKVQARLNNDGLTLRVATTTVARDADLLVFETDEGFQTRGEWPAHVWSLTETWFGPWEVNFERYPTWDGDPRILVMTQARARQVDLPLVSTGLR